MSNFGEGAALMTALSVISRTIWVGGVTHCVTRESESSQVLKRKRLTARATETQPPGKMRRARIFAPRADQPRRSHTDAATDRNGRWWNAAINLRITERAPAESVAKLFSAPAVAVLFIGLNFSFGIRELFYPPHASPFVKKARARHV